jgi:hypothetical protein
MWSERGKLSLLLHRFIVLVVKPTANEASKEQNRSFVDEWLWLRKMISRAFRMLDRQTDRLLLCLLFYRRRELVAEKYTTRLIQSEHV